MLDAQRLLQLPMLAAEPGGGGLKLFRVQIARPILLDRPLQLPAGAMRGNPRFAAMAIRRAPVWAKSDRNGMFVVPGLSSHVVAVTFSVRELA